MKHTLLTYFVGVMGLLLVAFQAQAATKVGTPAPDFELVDTNGNSHKLSDFAGKVVVLEWTNHDCPFVRKHYDSENMQTLQKDYTAKDVVWLSIVSSAEGKQGYVTPEEGNTVLKEEKAQPTAKLLDPTGTVGQLYGAKTTPHMYVVDKDMNLAYMGAIDSIPSAYMKDVSKADNYVVAALDSVLAGEPVAKPSTRPYGCSVKY